jgi:hypothetical protein
MLLQVPADNRRRGFLPTEDAHYEGVAQEQLSYRGETGAQSSILPLLTGLMKNRHRENALIHHLAALRDYMPAEHRALIGFDRVVTGKNIHWLPAFPSAPNTLSHGGGHRQVRCSGAGHRDTRRL